MFSGKMSELETKRDDKKDKAEVQLNVTYFYDNEESLNLISAEEALGGYDDDSDIEIYARPEKVYEVRSHFDSKSPFSGSKESYVWCIAV